MAVSSTTASHDRSTINPSGISNAFTEAEMLADEIHAGLVNEANLDGAVRRDQERRDARWLLQVLAQRPQAARRFFAFFEGQEAELDFLAPANIAQVMSSS